MIENHLEYAMKISQKCYQLVPVDKRGLVTREDLLSAGYEGLVKAANKYESGGNAKFTTYAYPWIKGEIFRELKFYIGKAALLMDDEKVQGIVSDERSVEETVESGFDISTIPEEEQIRIISAKLREFELTEEEIRVYLAVNGIGREKVTNLSVLAREMGKRELFIRRIRQSAEDKVKRLTS